jgi:hypothetical protein
MSDWSKVEKLVREYVTDVENGHMDIETILDYDRLVFEAAVEAIFGIEIWNRVNPELDKAI